MLSNKNVVTTMPVVDVDRAKNFYEEKLELKLLEEMDEGLLFEAGNETQIFLYKRDSTKADHTAATFVVDDIENEVNNLKKKGIVFEEYDFPNLKTVNSIASREKFKSAWFKDTEGNIIAITKMG